MRLMIVPCLVLCACSREQRDPPVRLARPVASPAAPTAPPPAALDPVATWQTAAFGHADAVVAVELGKPSADGLVFAKVLAEWRGYKLAAELPLDGLQQARDATPGSRWLIAASLDPWSSSAQVLARVPDSPAERTRIAALVTPPWRETPIVALVTIASVRRSTAAADGQVVYDVERVLRGPLAATRVADFVQAQVLRHPLVAGPQRYVLSAWQVDKGAARPDPFVVAAGLTPVSASELAVIEHELAADPRAAVERRFSDAAARLEATSIDFHFHEAPLVVDGVISQTEEEATNCGGLHFVVSATQALRGPAPTCQLGSFGMGGMRQLSTRGTASPAFVGGGHCYYGPERIDQRWLASGFAACGMPSAMLPWSAAADARVHADLDAPAARFAARPVEPAVFGAKPTAPPAQVPTGHAFEPALAVEAMAFTHWTRFEVVRRRDSKLPDGRTYSWIECRAIEQGRWAGAQPPERWMFAGADLPSWPVGSRWWGASPPPTSRAMTVDTQTPELFLPALFLPGDPVDAHEALLRVLGRLRSPT